MDRLLLKPKKTVRQAWSTMCSTPYGVAIYFTPEEILFEEIWLCGLVKLLKSLSVGPDNMEKIIEGKCCMFCVSQVPLRSFSAPIQFFLS